MEPAGGGSSALRWVLHFSLATQPRYLAPGSPAPWRSCRDCEFGGVILHPTLLEPWHWRCSRQSSLGTTVMVGPLLPSSSVGPKFMACRFDISASSWRPNRLSHPFVFVLAVASLWLALARRRDADSEPRMLLIAAVGPMLLYFLLHSMHARVHGNWLAPVYPVLAVLGSEAAFQISTFGERMRPCIALARRLSVPLGLSLAGVGYFGRHWWLRFLSILASILSPPRSRDGRISP